MALSKLDKTSEDHKMLETFDDEWAVVLRDLINKVNTGFDKTNEHINKVASMQSEINTEKNKTGITQSQADAITDNTKQAKSLANDIATLNLGVQQNVPTNDKKLTAIVISSINIAKSGITLDLNIRLSDGGKFKTSLPLTAQK